MRIAFLVTDFPEISETFILDQITWLLDRGCEIDVYAQRLHRGGIVQPDVAAYSLLERGFQLLPPPLSSRSARIFRGLRDIAVALSKSPVALVRVLNPVRLGIQAFRLSSFYRVAPFLSQQRYDVVHCHFGPNGILGAELQAAGLLKAPLVTQFHGYDASRYIRQNGSDVYKTLFLQGTAFLCVSERISERLVDLGCPRGKVLVQHTGVKVGDIQFRSRDFALPGTIRVLTVGRLVEKKGVEFGIRAICRLVRECPHVHYTIVGDGPERSALVELCRVLGIVGHVDFAGAAPRDVVAAMMSDADILLAPSVSAANGDEEGIPVVLMEALASGLPVVSTRHGGIPELISHRRSGLLTAERDSDGLAEQMKFLATHPIERQSMAVEGRRIVERDYDVAKLNAALFATYQRLLHGLPPSGPVIENSR
jgi:colanic acid/amylovoran biosynthesis glycosyltransferase